MSREAPHPRTETADLRGAAMMLVRKALAEVVPLVGHSDPIASRLAAIGSAEAGQIGGNGQDG